MSSKEVKIIVGANYGDEGKGFVTHYHSREALLNGKSCVNVLYNGGCQRGHTVENLEGFRHVFHHFGSGAFDYADTYFDRDFIVNPMEFVREFHELEQKGVRPKCYINPYCRVTTPFDMLINQIVEQSRGTNRHGSCGMGIWETSQRYVLDTHQYNWHELSNISPKSISIYLEYIKNDYLYKRLSDYGIKEVPKEYEQIINSKGLIEHFISDLIEMKSNVVENEEFYFNNDYDVIIFEGAQGLALDEDNIKEYPNVTASKTGSYVPILRLTKEDDIEVCYITRSYFTRHGAGNFDTECDVSKINPAIQDFTNLHNDFQGSIRYGKFDIDSMLERINSDKDSIKSVCKYCHIEEDKILHSLFITHLNYTNGDICGVGSISELRQIFSKLYLSYDKYGKDIRIMG